MGANGLKEIDDRTFQADVLDAASPVLVDFGAAWCAPCRAIAPTVAALAKDYAGRLDVATMDIDTATQTAQRYEIRSVPTLLLFKQGQVVAQLVGAVSRARIEEAIRKVI